MQEWEIDPLTYRGLELNDFPAYHYPQAGAYETPPEVLMAIQRFHTLPDEIKETTPLLWWLLGQSTQPLKMAQNDSAYVNWSPVHQERCNNCVFAFKRVVDGKLICSQIRGMIRGLGWCRLWQDTDGRSSRLA